MLVRALRVLGIGVFGIGLALCWLPRASGAATVEGQVVHADSARSVGEVPVTLVVSDSKGGFDRKEMKTGKDGKFRFDKVDSNGFHALIGGQCLPVGAHQGVGLIAQPGASNAEVLPSSDSHDARNIARN